MPASNGFPYKVAIGLGLIIGLPIIVFILASFSAGVPLSFNLPELGRFNIRGGVRFGERHELLIEFENINDRNYRGISWGVDAPGRGVFLKYNTRF